MWVCACVRVSIKKYVHGSRRCMHGYSLTNYRFSVEDHVSALDSQKRGPQLMFAQTCSTPLQALGEKKTWWHSVEQNKSCFLFVSFFVCFLNCPLKRRTSAGLCQLYSRGTRNGRLNFSVTHLLTRGTTHTHTHTQCSSGFEICKVFLSTVR